MSDSEAEDEIIDNKQLKMVFLGDTAVGKTSIIRRFCYDDFTRHYNQTVGADFYIKRLTLPTRREVKIRITDIGGMEIKGQMLSNYLFNTDIIIFTYDITNMESFDNLVTWMDIVKRISAETAAFTILGNKCDLEHKRAVRLDKTKRFVNECRLVNYLVSAKTGEHVNASLTDVVGNYLGLTVNTIASERKIPAHITKSGQLSHIRSRERISKSPGNSTKGNVAKETNVSVCSIQ